MSLNENAVKYVPTSAKNGTIITLCLANKICDVERLGIGGIIDSLYNPNKSFVGVVTVAPKDIPNAGLYSLYNPQDMVSIRLSEQQKAANVGAYNSIYVLNHSCIADEEEEIIEDYVALIKAYKPEVIYTYSPYETCKCKLRTLKNVIIALSRIIDDYKPQLILGSHLSGSLDFLDSDKVYNLGVDNKADYVHSILNVYDSAKEAGDDLSVAHKAVILNGIESVEDLKTFIGETIEDFKSRTLGLLD